MNQHCTSDYFASAKIWHFYRRYTMAQHFLYALPLLFIVGFTASAQLVTFNTSANTGLETTENSASNATGVLPTTLILGNGINPAANDNRFGGNGYFETGDATPTDLADAVSDSEYFEFTITPTAGNQFTATDFNFIYSNSSTGGRNVTLRTSTDGFTTFNELGTLTNLTVVSTTPPVSTPYTTIGFDDFSSSSAVTFRLYVYGATAADGSFGLDKNTSATVLTNPNLTLGGTTEPIPEPGTVFGGLALLGLVGYRERRRLKALWPLAPRA